MRSTRNSLFASGLVPVALLLCSCSSTFTTADAGLPDAKADTEKSDAESADAGKKDSGGSHDSGKDAKDAEPPTGCAAYATAYCDYLAACEKGTLTATYGTTASCETVEGAVCTNALGAPGSGITTAWTSSCGASYETRTAACSAGPVVPTLPSPSDPCAVVGTSATGAACGIDSECQSDSCLREGTLCGVCAKKGAALDPCGPGTGVACARGLDCSDSKAVCVTLVAPGGTCDFGTTTECQAGTYCLGADGSTTSGTCVKEGLTVGAPCTAVGGRSECFGPGGLYCDTATNKCASITYGGGTSSCGVADGGTADNACSSGSCVSGACATTPTKGQPCVVGGQACVAGTACIVDEAGTSGTCTTVETHCASSDAGTDPFTFSPSNVSLAQIYAVAGGALPEIVTSSCVIRTDPMGPETDCLDSPIEPITLADGSTVDLVVVQSLVVASTGSMSATGSVPVIIVSLSDITFMGGNLQANSETDTGGPGGAAGGDVGAGSGSGGGLAGSNTALIGGGGGSFCGIGGAGGGSTAVSSAYGLPGIRPLVGGSGGGGGDGGGDGGGGVQLVAAGALTIGTGSYITVSGGGGEYGGDVCAYQNAGGGGSGGALLLEAPTVTMAGILAAKGGGGGGGDDDTNSQDGWDSVNVGSPVSTPAAGGVGPAVGGVGSAGASTAGTLGGAGAACGGGDYAAGGGGGGAGRIRINSATGAATITGTLSPDTTTSCMTQGDLRSITEGP